MQKWLEVGHQTIINQAAIVVIILAVYGDQVLAKAQEPNVTDQEVLRGLLGYVKVNGHLLHVRRVIRNSPSDDHNVHRILKLQPESRRRLWRLMTRFA